MVWIAPPRIRHSFSAGRRLLEARSGGSDCPKPAGARREKSNKQRYTRECRIEVPFKVTQKERQAKKNAWIRLAPGPETGKGPFRRWKGIHLEKGKFIFI
jgi:hypothetical protein